VRLYSYYRSSAAYRVRIALNLKGQTYDTVPIDLLQGEHREDTYQARNPQGLIPALELPDGTVIPQSIAIVEFLEERIPEPPLLPKDPVERARIRSLVTAIACDLHPLCNSGVIRHLEAHFDATQADVLTWLRTWMYRGFGAIEAALAGRGTPFAGGANPGVLDVFLVPQVYNARRFAIDLSAYPRIEAVTGACQALEPFAAAAPERQPDYQP